MTNKQIIKIPFGNNAMKRLKDQSIQEGKRIKLSSFLQDLLYEELRNQEYSKDSIARIFFESAIDYYSISLAQYLIENKLKFHKVPKFVAFEIDNRIGKVE